MDNLDSIRLRLKKYLAETPKDVLKKKFDEFNQASFEGVTVNEYFSRFSEQYTFFDNNISNIISQDLPMDINMANLLPYSETVGQKNYVDELLAQKNSSNTKNNTNSEENFGENSYAMAA
jgi:hypothetical protein